MSGSFSFVPAVTVASFSARFEQPTSGTAQPHGCVTVLMELGEGSMTVAGLREQSVIVGLRQSPTLFAHQGSIDCLEIKLAPSVALQLGLDLGELGGSVTSLDSLFGRNTDALANRLKAADATERKAVVEDIVWSRLRYRRTTSVIESLQYLERSCTADGLREIASDTGVSRSTMWRHAKAALGMSSHRYLALRRFERAAAMLGAGLPAALVAANAGYFDQSHLHREVRRFANVNPTELCTEHDATYVQDNGSLSDEYLNGAKI